MSNDCNTIRGSNFGRNFLGGVVCAFSIALVSPVFAGGIVVIERTINHNGANHSVRQYFNTANGQSHFTHNATSLTITDGKTIDHKPNASKFFKFLKLFLPTGAAMAVFSAIMGADDAGQDSDLKQCEDLYPPCYASNHVNSYTEMQVHWDLTCEMPTAQGPLLRFWGRCSDGPSFDGYRCDYIGTRRDIQDLGRASSNSGWTVAPSCGATRPYSTLRYTPPRICDGLLELECIEEKEQELSDRFEQDFKTNPHEWDNANPDGRPRRADGSPYPTPWNSGENTVPDIYEPIPSDTFEPYPWENFAPNPDPTNPGGGGSGGGGGDITVNVDVDPWGLEVETDGAGPTIPEMTIDVSEFFNPAPPPAGGCGCPSFEIPGILDFADGATLESPELCNALAAVGAFFVFAALMAAGRVIFT